jgi:hypothetical protein
VKSDDQITFFTEGLPYGFAMPSEVVSCHVERRWAAQLIFDNILAETEQAHSSMGACVIFSPEDFPIAGTPSGVERACLAQSLSKRGFIVKALWDENASVENLDNYAEHFPYDILHVCSHGMTVPAIYIKRSFRDRTGAKHIMEYHEVQSAHHTDEIDDNGEPMFMLVRRNFPYRLDGLEWATDELSHALPKYVFEDVSILLTNQKVDDDEIVTRVRTSYRPPSSASIVCSDGINQCTFQSLAAMGTPLIFNNSCTSWLEVGRTCLACGARGYVGTLWDVQNTTAVEAARAFYTNAVERNQTYATAVMEINREIRSERDRGIYAYWGLHFAKMPSPGVSRAVIRKRLRDRILCSIRNFSKYCEDVTLDDMTRQNSARVIRFLRSSLVEDLGYSDGRS